MRAIYIWIPIIFSMFLPSTASWSQPKSIVGWLENVRVYPGALLIQAKLDTGADHSSINAPQITEFDRDGEKWVEFCVMNKRGEKINLEKKLNRVASVKRKGAPSQKRPVITLGICLGDYYKEIEVNLVDRRNFLYPMIIGRSFMEGILLIDPSIKYSTKPECREAHQP